VNTQSQSAGEKIMGYVWERRGMNDTSKDGNARGKGEELT